MSATAESQDKWRPPSIPRHVTELETYSSAIGFSMSCELLTGALIRTLAASRLPTARYLEIGTGTGVGTAWLSEAMTPTSSLITIEKEFDLTKLARQLLRHHPIKFIAADAHEWLSSYSGPKFDFIFADCPAGKFTDLSTTLDLVAPGGIYVLDDLIPIPGWRAGQEEKVNTAIDHIKERSDFFVTPMNWAGGMLVASKIYR